MAVPRIKAGYLVGITIATIAVLQAPLFAQATIGSHPSNPRADEPHSSSIFIHTLKAGESVNEALTVTNSAKETQPVRVYATDSTIASGGVFSCKQFGDPDVAVGSWIKMSQETLTVEPGQPQQVPFTITVPADATAGQHDGCVVVEPAPDARALKPGVNILTRTGTRVSITVPGKLVRSLQMTGLKIDRSGGKPLLAVTIINTGNMDVDFFLHAVTHSKIMGQGLTVNGGLHTAMAGQSTTLNFGLPQLFFGGWLESTSLYEVDRTGYTAVDRAVTDPSELKRLRGSDFNPAFEDSTTTPWTKDNELAMAGPTLSYFVGPTAGGLAVYIGAGAAIVVLIILLILVHRRNRKSGRTSKR